MYWFHSVFPETGCGACSHLVLHDQWKHRPADLIGLSLGQSKKQRKKKLCSVAKKKNEQQRPTTVYRVSGSVAGVLDAGLLFW